MANNPITYLCADCGGSGSITLTDNDIIEVSPCACVKENA